MDEQEDGLAQDTLIEAVRNQIQEKDPQETEQAYQRLVKDGYEPDEALRLIALVLEDQVSAMLESSAPFDLPAYVKSLQLLPLLPDT